MTCRRVFRDSVPVELSVSMTTQAPGTSRESSLSTMFVIYPTVSSRGRHSAPVQVAAGASAALCVSYQSIEEGISRENEEEQVTV